MLMRHLPALLLLSLTCSTVAASEILSMRERAEVLDRWLDIRVETVLPEVMRREGVDMWVLISRKSTV